MPGPQCPNCGVRHRPGSRAERECRRSGSAPGAATGLMSWVPSGAASASGDFGVDHLPPTDTGPVPLGGPDVFHHTAPDEVLNCDGIRFVRADAVHSDDYVYEPYHVRVQFDRELDDDKMNHVAQLMGYAYRETVVGESLGSPVADGTNSFYVEADTTKTRRDELGQGLSEFEERLLLRILKGSPVRKTNRAGEGTKGTRLIPPLGPDYGGYTLYYG